MLVKVHHKKRKMKKNCGNITRGEGPVGRSVMEQKKTLSVYDRQLEQLRFGRKTGVLITAAVSAVLLLMSMPFVDWIYLENISALFGRAGITREMAATLYASYSVFSLLSFVQNSGMGELGLYAMMLLLLLIATWCFHVIYIWKIVRNRSDEGGKGELKLYTMGKAAMLLTVLLGIAAVGFAFYSNWAVGMNGFRISWVIPVEMLAAAAAYILIKRLEVRERARCHEHGLAKEFKKNWVLFLMLVPICVFFLINSYLPMAGIYFAFVNFNFTDGLWASPFVGLKNFEFLFQSQMGRLIRNTVLYNVVFIGLGNVIQIFFAILVSQLTVKWFKKTGQTLMFMPYFVSYVLLKVMVYSLLEYQYGAINNMLRSSGGTAIDFYNTPAYWPFLITLFYLWKSVGYGMVVYLATIMGIDNELYEAAKVDGANVFQRIRYITLPQVKPTFIILLIYSLGGIMKGNFELFYQTVGNNGLLYEVTDILDTYVYRITIGQPLSIGLGSAASLFQSIFGFVVVMVTNWVIRKKEADYALF